MKSLSRRVTSEAAMALLCLALTFIFFHSAVFPRTKTFLCGYDNTYQYYPWMHKLADDWRALTPPLWDFSVEAGFPFPGEWNTAAFYPVNILYVWLTGIPTPTKLDVLIVFHFAAAMWGMSLFLRQRGIETLPSLFGGAVFCWIGPVASRAFQQANIFVGLIYLPWVLYFFELGLAARNPWRNSWTGLAGLALAFSLLAGHPQPFIHNSLLLGLFAVFLLFEKRTLHLSWTTNLSRTASALLMVAVIAFLFAYVQLASSHEYFARAYRWVGLPEPVKALQTVVPLEIYNRYNLSIPDLLSVYTGRSSAAEGGTLYLTITALVFACLGLGVPGRWRWFVLIIIGFILLVALAGNTPFGRLAYRLPLLNIVRQPVRILYLYQFCVATLAASGLQLALNGIPRRGWRVAIFVVIMGIFACEARQNGSPWWVSTNSPLTADQAYKKTLLTTFLEERNREDPGMYRVLARPKDLIPPNSGDIFRFSTALGYRSSMLIAYFDLLKTDWSLSSQGLDQVGARYVVTDKPSQGLTLLSSFDSLLVYERPTARPIFHWSGSSDQAASDAIGPVKWRRNGVNLQVATNQPNKLTFAATNYPGWRVRINSVATTIDSKWPHFMSVTVPAGKSTVQWSYRPWWLIPGMCCWLVGVVMLIAMKLSALRERQAS
jgi:Bacterial membrane protein YfhO